MARHATNRPDRGCGASYAVASVRTQVAAVQDGEWPAADDCGEESLEVGEHVSRRSARLELGDDSLPLRGCPLRTPEMQIRRERLAQAGPRVLVDGRLERRVLAGLPFALTADQTAAVQKIWRLMQGPSPMGLLLQGDVGTGKTAVAWCAAMAAIAAGWQVAFLAPTELLAEQHYRCVRELCGEMGASVAVLTAGSGDRRDVQKMLAADRECLVFGTHALFSKSTGFARLGLVIIDEQHRFGVEQKDKILDELLVMTEAAEFIDANRTHIGVIFR